VNDGQVDLQKRIDTKIPQPWLRGADIRRASPVHAERGTLKVRIPNPHKSDTVDGSLVKEILGQASIGSDQWDKA
jgi:hypothetical protein